MLHKALLILLFALHHPVSASPPATTRPATQPYGDLLIEPFFPPPPGSVEVVPGLSVYAQFSAFREGKGEKAPGKPADVLRLSDDPSYGIHLLFFPGADFKGGEVHYREVLTLPAKPGGWGEGFGPHLARALRHKRTISPDGRACTTEITLRVQPGQMVPSVTTKEPGPDGQEEEFLYLLYPFPLGPWGLADDDPPGEWTIEAFVNDKPVARATFTVVIAEPQGGIPSTKPHHPTSRLAR